MVSRGATTLWVAPSRSARAWPTTRSLRSETRFEASSPRVSYRRRLCETTPVFAPLLPLPLIMKSSTKITRCESGYKTILTIRRRCVKGSECAMGWVEQRAPGRHLFRMSRITAETMFVSVTFMLV